MTARTGFFPSGFAPVSFVWFSRLKGATFL
jgi:hypothetical protein